MSDCQEQIIFSGKVEMFRLARDINLK